MIPLEGLLVFGIVLAIFSFVHPSVDLLLWLKLEVFTELVWRKWTTLSCCWFKWNWCMLVETLPYEKIWLECNLSLGMFKREKCEKLGSQWRSSLCSSWSSPVAVQSSFFYARIRSLLRKVLSLPLLPEWEQPLSILGLGHSQTAHTESVLVASIRVH